MTILIPIAYNINYFKEKYKYYKKSNKNTHTYALNSHSNHNQHHILCACHLFDYNDLDDKYENDRYTLLSYNTEIVVKKKKKNNIINEIVIVNSRPINANTF